MLKAGFSRIDVTPPLGSEISGYFEKRYAKGVLDPLYLNAVAIGNGEKTVLLMAIDYIGIRLPYNIKIREAISASTGVPTDHIFISALHQHTSVCIADTNDKKWGAIDDDEFISILYRKFADAAVMAINDMKDATVGTAELEVEEPIAFVRRYFTEDGGVQTNPTPDYKLIGRCDEADNTMRLIRIFRKDADDIAIINFSTHPDVVHGECFSADWPGFSRSYTEKKLNGVKAIFFTGCQGDSNHVDFLNREAIRDGYEHSKHMGEVVSNAVVAVWDKTKESFGDRIFAENRIIYNKTNLEGIEDYDKCKKFKEDYEAGRLSYQPHITELAYANRIIGLIDAKIFNPIPITVISFGSAVMVGFGGEPFTAIARTVRAIAPEKFVLTAVCTNGYEGYYPTIEAFEQGGYEAEGSIFTPTLESEITETIKNIFENIN